MNETTGKCRTENLPIASEIIVTVLHGWEILAYVHMSDSNMGLVSRFCIQFYLPFTTLISRNTYIAVL